VFSGHGYGAGDLKTYLGNEKPKNTGEIQRQKYVFSDWEHLFARTKYIPMDKEQLKRLY